jgi:hypothetical protein
MSDHAFDFLQSWIVENVNATTYEDKDAAEHLAHDRVWEAKTRAFEGRVAKAPQCAAYLKH